MKNIVVKKKVCRPRASSETFGSKPFGSGTPTSTCFKAQFPRHATYGMLSTLSKSMMGLNSERRFEIVVFGAKNEIR
jgi:hypothetical protein